MLFLFHTLVFNIIHIHSFFRSLAYFRLTIVILLYQSEYILISFDEWNADFGLLWVIIYIMEERIDKGNAERI